MGGEGIIITNTSVQVGVSGGAGADGGGIWADVPLIIMDSTVSRNEAGSAGPGGERGGSGGGLFTRHDLTMIRSAVSENKTGVSSSSIFNFSGGSGGGLMTEGNPSVRLFESSSFFNNVAMDRGKGGGMYAINGIGVTMVNSTLAGNRTDGNPFGAGMEVTGTPLHMIHCTVVSNESSSSVFATQGAGIFIWPSSSLVLENSIVAGNVADFSPDIFRSGGSNVVVVVAGENLIGNNQNISDIFPAGPLVGTPASPLDPLMAPIADTGGPTPTAALFPTSPALNAAVATTNSPAVDQRGLSRPQGASPDLGAYEEIDSVAYVDSDSDGMDDRLELLYEFVVGTPDGHLDRDGDGIHNADELLCRTNPRDGMSYLGIHDYTVLEVDGMGKRRVQVTWSCYPGEYYGIQIGPAAGEVQDSPTVVGDFTPGPTSLMHTEELFLDPGFNFLTVRRHIPLGP